MTRRTFISGLVGETDTPGATCRSLVGDELMRSLKRVTPGEAKVIWASIPNPSARRVAKALTQSGRRVHHSTVARWDAKGWRGRPGVAGKDGAGAARPRQHCDDARYLWSPVPKR